MIVPLYAPGEWIAVVTDGRIALLPAGTDPALVGEVWTAAREGADLTATLQVLVRAGIAHLPPFALVSVEDGRVRAVVRGDVEVEVEAGTTRVVRGAQVSTWTEEIITGARSVTVRTAALTGSTTDVALPVLSGVVHAAGVRVTLVAQDVEGTSRPTAGPPVPVATPEPEPEPETEPEPTLPAGAAGPDVTVRHTLAPPGPPLEDGRAGHDDLAQILLPPLVDAPAGEQPVPCAPTVDHDGMTVLSSDVVALRRQLPDWAGDAVPGPLAVPAAQKAPPAKIQLSSGLVVSLNRPVLLGRAPQVSRVSNSELPRLVTVPSPNQDISRTHAEVRMDGEDVLVTDLRSTNGVLLLRQGHGPQRLHPGDATVVEPGVVVDLGEGVTFIVERGT